MWGKTRNPTKIRFPPQTASVHSLLVCRLLRHFHGFSYTSVRTSPGLLVAKHERNDKQPLPLPEYREFISAFIEHSLFPKLFDCMRCYSIEGSFNDEISLNRYLDKHEFLHFQISNIIVGVLNDLRSECVPYGKEITALDNVDMKKKLEFLNAQQEKQRVASLRLIEELDARQKQHREEANKRMLDHWNEYESEEP